MKLVTFRKEDDVQYIGALVDNERGITCLQVGAEIMDGFLSPFFTSMLAFLQGNAATRDKAQATVEYITTQRPPGGVVATDSVTLLAPLPRPASIRDCMAFEQHILNCIRAVGLKRWAPLDEWIEKTFGRKKSFAWRANQAFYERPAYYKGNRFSDIDARFSDEDTHSSS